MQPIQAMCVSLLMIAFFYALFYRMKKPLRVLPKCAATAVCAATAAAGLLNSGENPLQSLLFWGIVACAVGDGLLEFHFLSGMAAFGLGHVLLIGELARLSGRIDGIMLGLWVLAYVCLLYAFRKDLRAMSGNKAPFLLYPALLLAMAAIAVTLPWKIGWDALSVAVGGVLFAVSDAMVAKGFFGKLSPAMDRLALALYYAAVYLLALGAWLL